MTSILIVEDEVLVAMEMAAILDDLGHQVAGIAPDLAAAREYYDQPLDLALVDLNLRDGLTGPQIAGQLSASGVPVIFITANPRQLGGGVAGTIGVITKPTDMDTVKAAVDYVVGRKHGRVIEPPARLKLFG